MPKDKPEIRFAGFTDAWEKRKLSNVVSLLGGNAFKSKDSVTEEGVRWLKIANVSNSGIKWNEESFLPSDYWERYPNYRIVAGDYVMALTRPIIAHELKIAKMPLGSNALLNQRVAKLIWNMNADFGFQLLRKRNVVDYIEQTISGTDPPNLSGNTFEKIMVSVPETVEQEKIGRFLETVDNLLAVNQRKVDLLKELKKGFLQKMFPKNGEDKPEIRFAGYTDVWEKHQLNEISKRFDNLRVPVTASDRTVGQIPYFGANGVQDYVNGYTHNGEFILIAEDGANDLQDYPIHYVHGKVWVNNHAHVIQAINNLSDNIFLLNALKTISIEPFLVGGGRAKLNADTLMNLSVTLPKVDEQLKIGQLMNNVGRLIVVNQRRVDLLKQEKKALLQKMFV